MAIVPEVLSYSAIDPREEKKKRLVVETYKLLGVVS